jgi:hypothetical protein
MWLDVILIGVMIINCFADLIIWRKLCERDELTAEGAIAPLTKISRMPFSKPTGKRKPHINDDAAAYLKEREKL